MQEKVPSVSSPIQEKIAWAEKQYDHLGHKILQDKALAALLDQLRKDVSASRKEMHDGGVAAICGRCDEKEGGSCCGRGIEDRYDAWTILINLLLGVKLPEAEIDSRNCIFLGPAGCTLLARHVICVNYICDRITDTVDPARLARMRECEGKELHTLFLLHEKLKSL
jgi:hypothetical protein